MNILIHSMSYFTSSIVNLTCAPTMLATEKNMTIAMQDIERGVAELERKHPGAEIPVVSSEIFILAEKI